MIKRLAVGKTTTGDTSIKQFGSGTASRLYVVDTHNAAHGAVVDFFGSIDGTHWEKFSTITITTEIVKSASVTAAWPFVKANVVSLSASAAIDIVVSF